MKTISFETSNKNKFEEARDILGSDFDLKRCCNDLSEIQSVNPEVVAEAKVMEAYKKIRTPVFVEDTGLHFDSLHGLPGALIRSFIERLSYDELAEIGNNQRAVAKTAIAYYDGKELFAYSGVILGKIVEPRGKSFAWDVIFQPEGYDLTFAQMSKAMKNSMSHRHKAFKGFKEFLQKSVSDGYK